MREPPDPSIQWRVPPTYSIPPAPTSNAHQDRIAKRWQDVPLPIGSRFKEGAELTRKTPSLDC